MHARTKEVKQGSNHEGGGCRIKKKHFGPKGNAKARWAFEHIFLVFFYMFFRFLFLRSPLSFDFCSKHFEKEK